MTPLNAFERARKVDRTILVLAAAGAALPLVIESSYYLSLLIVVGLHALVVLGLCLLMGFGGQVSLGQGAFYGVGAYTSAILSTTYGLSPWLGLAAAAVAAGLLAAVIGRPVLRLRHHYLALATLALGVIGFILFKQLPITGGPSGLGGIPSPGVGPLALSSSGLYVYLVWFLLALAMVLANRLIHSRVGRALRAIRGSETAAQCMSIDVSHYKVLVFVISGIFAGLAGGLYAHWVGYISPSSFDILTSILFVIMVVIGGAETIWGAVVGAAAIAAMREVMPVAIAVVMPSAGGEVELVVYGLALVAILLYQPRGLAPLLLDVSDAGRGAGLSPPALEASTDDIAGEGR